MKADLKKFCHMMCAAAELMNENSGKLSEIDSRFGDGDHGITISKIAKVILSAADECTEDNIHDLLENLGDEIMCVNGGSAGPLYGTMIGGMAEALGDETEIDGAQMKKMFEASLDAMRDITKAAVGDKTMMDALIPAVEAAQNAADELEEVLDAAQKAALEGAEESKKFVSKFGRARSYGEETIGTPDAGAVSTSLFIQGLYLGLSR